MSPTPRDAQRSSDNNPQRILEQAVNTIIGQMPPKLVPPRNSDEYIALKKDVTKQVLSRHLAVQLSNQVPDDIMVTGGASLMLRAPNQPPSSVFYAAFWSSAGFPASMEAARGIFGGLVAEVVPEGMSTTVGGGAGSVHTLCSLHLPACAAGHDHPSQRPYSPHLLPKPAYGRLGPLTYGREEAESKKLNTLNFCLIPGDSASI